MTPVGIAAVTGSLAILDAFFSTAGQIEHPKIKTVSGSGML